MNKALHTVSKMQRARAVAAKIKHQFPDCPEGRLHFAVVEGALHDLAKCSRSKTDMTEKKAAYHYLKVPGGLWNAEICGVSPAWIRSLLKRVCL